jgi:hypothetical protein
MLVPQFYRWGEIIAALKQKIWEIFSPCLCWKYAECAYSDDTEQYNRFTQCCLNSPIGYGDDAAMAKRKVNRISRELKLSIISILVVLIILISPIVDLYRTVLENSSLSMFDNQTGYDYPHPDENLSQEDIGWLISRFNPERVQGAEEIGIMIYQMNNFITADSKEQYWTFKLQLAIKYYDYGDYWSALDAYNDIYENIKLSHFNTYHLRNYVRLLYSSRQISCLESVTSESHAVLNGENLRKLIDALVMYEKGNYYQAYLSIIQYRFNQLFTMKQRT